MTMEDHPLQNETAETKPANNIAVANRQPEKPRRRSLLWLWIVIGAIAFIGLGFVGAQLALFLNRTEPSMTRQSAANDGNKIVTQEEEDVASVVAKVSQSVVSVVTTTQSMSSPRLGSERGAGTGIIVGSDGYIMTNKHVVDGATTVQVILADGTQYDDVKVLGTDPLNDIAFIKIPHVSDLPVAEFGDSTSVRIGQKVIAIGNSLGQYQNTVTSGIISGTGRPVSAEDGTKVETLTDLIQTDAAINPGNSGGPLLNLQGQVIGLNTAIVQDAQGIGFAIPIGATKGALKGVLKTGTVEHAYLGISYVQVTADTAKQYDLKVKSGAYVFKSSVTSAIVGGGPADKAGIRDKDIITKVGDIPIGDRGSVASLVAEYAPGDTINLTLLRNDKTIVVRVTLAAYSAN